MSFGETFAQRNVRGMLTRAALAWVLITPAVVAAAAWWSHGAAVAVAVIGVALYVTVATRYLRRHPGSPAG